MPRTSKRPFSIALLLALTGLVGCVQNPDAGPVSGGPGAPVLHAQANVDARGRVVRMRAERNWDDSIGREALAALRDSDPEGFRGVSALAWDGGVLLAGAVARPEQRRRADQLVRGIKGVTQVFDELALTENPGLPQYVPDVHMEQRIYAGLLGQDAITGAYEVRVVNGVAYLVGTSLSTTDTEKALEFARGFDGIKWVVDHVSVR